MKLWHDIRCHLKEYDKSTMENLKCFLDGFGSIENYNSYINNINSIIDDRTKEIEKEL